MESAPSQRLLLCAGLQSSGSTLLSWCFLQRPDTAGILDMKNDLLATNLAHIASPVVWIKMTIGAFRWADAAGVYTDLGWKPEPVMIVRDVRAVYASLSGKSYGFNGTTAEEPPLRMRLRRFLADWREFQDEGRPIYKFEEMALDPEGSLRRLCAKMSLPWDAAMLTWPKPMADILPKATGNKTFLSSLGRGGLAQTLIESKFGFEDSTVPRAECDWLDETFSEFNIVHGYPAQIDPIHISEACAAPPAFFGTKRERMRRLLHDVASIDAEGYPEHL